MPSAMEATIVIDRPWYHLKLSTIGAITPKGAEFFSNIVKANRFYITELRDIDFFSLEWLNNLSSGVHNEVTSAMIFFRPADFQVSSAHIDLNTNMIKQTGKIVSISAAINLIYEGNHNDGEMIWYEPPINTPAVQWTEAGTAFVDFDLETLTESSRCCIGNNLTLVRTDIPHNVIMGSTPRLSISLRLKWAKWKDPNWNGIVDQCRPFLMDK